MQSHGVLRATPLALGIALAAVGACLVDGYEIGGGAGGSTTTSSSTSSSTAGGAGGGGGSGPSCQHAQWPSPPSASDPGSEDLDLVFVARRIDFGEGDLSDGPQLGYDLDNRCTCQGDGDSCREPDFATADHCDGPGGRDNAVAQLFGELGMFDPDFTSAEYTAAAEEGRDSMIIRVRHYNGLPNDAEVTLSIHPSYGTDDDPCNLPDTVPAWDGNDRWAINAPSLNAPPSGTGGSACGANGYDVDDARYFDANAFVRDGTVVASLPELPLEFTSGDDSLPVALVAGFVTGRLELEGGQWYLRDGLLVGRWTVAEFFKLIGAITHQNVPLCTDHQLYPFLKGALCDYPDIASTLAGPTTPCDAFSFGMAVDAYPARIGSVLPGSQRPRPCDPALDPIYDDCESP